MTTAALDAPNSLDRFHKGYQLYNGMSEKRQRQQRQELERLAAFAGKARPEECDAADLRNYLAALAEDLHVNTVRWRHGMLSPFFTWGFQNGIVGAEQLMAIKLVKDPKGATGQTEPRPYGSKELRAFWEALEARLPLDPRFDHWMQRYQEGRSRYRRVGDHVMRRQCEAIFGLALEAGLRSVEIFTADIDHIHPDNEMIIVPQRGERSNGKDKYREVPFTDPLRNSIHHWLEARAQLGVVHDRPWIVGWKNTAHGVALKAPYKTGFRSIPVILGGWEYHRFRHTCATLWLRSGMKLEIVQRLLGHATLQQTLAYTKIERGDIERAASANEDKFRQLTRRER